MSLRNSVEYLSRLSHWPLMWLRPQYLKCRHSPRFPLFPRFAPTVAFSPPACRKEGLWGWLNPLSQQIIYFFLLHLGARHFTLFDRYGDSFKMVGSIRRSLILRCLNRFLGLNRISVFYLSAGREINSHLAIGDKRHGPALTWLQFWLSSYPLFSHHQDAPRVNLNCKTVAPNPAK